VPWFLIVKFWRGAGFENYAIATSFGQMLALAMILLYSRPEKVTISINQGWGKKYLRYICTSTL